MPQKRLLINKQRKIKMEFTVEWHVEDGYAGKARPQKTVVKPYEDYTKEEWEKMDEFEKKEYIDDCVDNDFRKSISFSIDNYGKL